MDVCREFEANEKLIWDVIHKMNCDPNEDLYQTGAIGLINAIRQFDPNKGFKFSTYASTCIRNEILRSLRGKKVATINLTPCIIENTVDDRADNSFDMSGELLLIIKDIINEKITPDGVDLFMDYYMAIAQGSIPRKQLDIALELGVSQRTVCRYLKKINDEIIKKWR